MADADYKVGGVRDHNLPFSNDTWGALDRPARSQVSCPTRPQDGLQPGVSRATGRQGTLM